MTSSVMSTRGKSHHRVVVMAPITVNPDLREQAKQHTYGAHQRKPAANSLHRRDRCGYALGEQDRVHLVRSDVKGTPGSSSRQELNKKKWQAAWLRAHQRIEPRIVLALSDPNDAELAAAAKIR